MTERELRAAALVEYLIAFDTGLDLSPAGGCDCPLLIGEEHITWNDTITVTDELVAQMKDLAKEMVYYMHNRDDDNSVFENIRQ